MRICRTCGKEKDESEFYLGELKYSRPRCADCSREYARNFRKEHPERAREIAAKTREKNREKIRQCQRDAYAKTKNDPDKIAARKACYDKGKDKWHASEREKRRVFNERWKRPCEKCGEARLYLIQFHHIDPATKSFCIGASATSRKTEDLEAEVKKCVCLCSNCHDEFHYFYGGKPKRPVEALMEYLRKD